MNSGSTPRLHFVNLSFTTSVNQACRFSSSTDGFTKRNGTYIKSVNYFVHKGLQIGLHSVNLSGPVKEVGYSPPMHILLLPREPGDEATSLISSL